MGRETHRRAEVPLTVEERAKLAEARAVVAELSEREPSPDHLTELGYEQRMARSRAAEIAVAAIGTERVQFVSVAKLAGVIYDFIWEGKVRNA